MRRTKEQAEQTKQDILQSALQLFAIQGYNQTSLSQIATHAHVTRGAVYWHFENKAQILQGLAQIYVQPTLDSGQSALSQAAKWQMLEDLMFEKIEEIVNKETHQQFFRIVHKQCGAAEDVREIAQRYSQFFLEQSALWVEVGKREGKIGQHLGAEYVHLHISSLFSGLVNTFLMGVIPFSLDNARLCIARTLNGFND